eukprot:CAMPEP_0117497662 /NCGR_PEP_ID=MMETSP0784-20121206/21298_1 /TAXON_ID=39447 /ORGANISM="" /LENGTH=1248 /DNA_ID=CAMNT_0005292691 /DNA_START=27 /DNA_END=3769 /DNA_ORIENTATION=+
MKQCFSVALAYVVSDLFRRGELRWKDALEVPAAETLTDLGTLEWLARNVSAWYEVATWQARVAGISTSALVVVATLLALRIRVRAASAALLRTARHEGGYAGRRQDVSGHGARSRQHRRKIDPAVVIAPMARLLQKARPAPSSTPQQLEKSAEDIALPQASQKSQGKASSKGPGKGPRGALAYKGSSKSTGKAPKGKGVGLPPHPAGKLVGKAGGKEGANIDVSTERTKGLAGGSAGPTFGRKIHWRPLEAVDGTIFEAIGNGGQLRPEAILVLNEAFQDSKASKVSRGAGERKIFNRSTGVSLLDANRAQQLAITFKKSPVSIQTLCDALRTLDFDLILNEEEIDNLLHVWPTGQECKLVLGFKGDLANLRDVERGVRQIAEVPRGEARLRAIRIAKDLDTLRSTSHTYIREVRNACKELLESPRWRALLAEALRLGNFINHGPSAEGGARGFPLDALLELRTLKGSGGATALHCLCISCAQEDAQFCRSLFEELSSVPRAAKSAGLEHMREKLARLNAEVEFSAHDLNEHRGAYAPATPKDESDIDDLTSGPETLSPRMNARDRSGPPALAHPAEAGGTAAASNEFQAIQKTASLTRPLTNMPPLKLQSLCGISALVATFEGKDKANRAEAEGKTLRASPQAASQNTSSVCLPPLQLQRVRNSSPVTVVLEEHDMDSQAAQGGGDIAADEDGGTFDGPSLSVPSPARVQELASKALTPRSNTSLQALAKALEPNASQTAAQISSTGSSPADDCSARTCTTADTTNDVMSLRSSTPGTAQARQLQLSSRLSTPNSSCTEPQSSLVSSPSHVPGSRSLTPPMPMLSLTGLLTDTEQDAASCSPRKHVRHGSSTDEHLRAILQAAGLTMYGMEQSTPRLNASPRLTAVPGIGMLFTPQRSASLGMAEDTDDVRLRHWVSGLPSYTPRGLRRPCASPRPQPTEHWARMRGGVDGQDTSFSSVGRPVARGLSFTMKLDSDLADEVDNHIACPASSISFPLVPKLHFLPTNGSPPEMPEEVPGCSSACGPPGEAMDFGLSQKNASCGAFVCQLQSGRNSSARLPPDVPSQPRGRPGSEANHLIGGSGRTDCDVKRRRRQRHLTTDSCSRLEALIARGRVMLQVAQEDLADVSEIVGKCERYFGVDKGRKSLVNEAGVPRSGYRAGEAIAGTRLFTSAAEFLQAFRAAWEEVHRSERWLPFLPPDETPRSFGPGTARSSCGSLQTALVSRRDTREATLNMERPPSVRSLQSGP